jgi:hypothetical protein
MAYVERKQDWAAPPLAPKADRLVVKATNIASAVVDAKRARVSCAPQLDVTSDGPLDLRLDCPPVARAAGRACPGSLTLALPRVKGRRVTLVTVTRRGNRVKRVGGKNVRRVTIGRVSPRAFSLRIYLHTNGAKKKQKRVIVQRRVAAC